MISPNSLRCHFRSVAKKLIARQSLMLCVAFLSSACTLQGHALGDELLTGSRFHQQLTKPINVVLDGKPFRETVNQLAESSKLNVWIYRHVDPTAPVAAGQLGPTVISAIDKVAAARNCIAMPVANVVLVGPEAWVHATSLALMPIPTSYSSKNVTWDDLTTPTEAFATASGTTSAKHFRLPHDLWPAVDLQQVKRPVAAALILAQFNRRLKSHADLRPSETIPINASGTAQRFYSQHSELKGELQDLDPKATAKTAGEKLIVKATAKTHRMLTKTLLTRTAAKAPAMVNNNTRTFSLNLVATPAGQAIRQFAANGGAQVQIDPLAKNAASQPVTLEAKDKTLPELVEMVAKQAGLRVTWVGKMVTVTLPGAN